MGIVGFEWAPEDSRRKLTLLQNRDNWRSRVIRRAAWDESNQILGGFCEQSQGTWFGCSIKGRVAFLVDTHLTLDRVSETVDSPELFPVRFLKSTLTPRKFAEQLEQHEKDNYVEVSSDDEETETGVAYNLIVADMTSNSMIYICKQLANSPKVDIKEVSFGVHILSSEGLDSPTPRDLRMRQSFSAMIRDYENRELPSPKEIAAKFMYDPLVGEEKKSALFLEMMDTHPTNNVIERYGTTSTTAFTVNSSKQVMFYERYLDHEDGGWKEHGLGFNFNN